MNARAPYTPEQEFAARELKTIFAVGRAVLTFVCTKRRYNVGSPFYETRSQTAFVLAVDRGVIVNVSRYIHSLTGLTFDPYAANAALRLGKVSPQEVARRIGLLLYLDEDKVRAEVIS